ncbi:5'-cyclic phosphodiesterase 4C (DPDE1) (PDE21), partial [Durusdinium trenchii]
DAAELRALRAHAEKVLARAGEVEEKGDAGGGGGAAGAVEKDEEAQGELERVLRGFVALQGRQAEANETLKRAHHLVAEMVRNPATVRPLQHNASTLIRSVEASLLRNEEHGEFACGVFVDSTLVDPDRANHAFGLVGLSRTETTRGTALRDEFLSLGQHCCARVCVTGKVAVMDHVLDAECDQGCTLVGFPLLKFNQGDIWVKFSLLESWKQVDSSGMEALMEATAVAINGEEQKESSDDEDNKARKIATTASTANLIKCQDGSFVGGVLVVAIKGPAAQTSSTAEALIREHAVVLGECGGFVRQAIETEARQEHLYQNYRAMVAAMFTESIFNNGGDVIKAILEFEDYVARILDAERCLVFLIDDSKDELWRRARDGRVRRVTISDATPFGRSITCGVGVTYASYLSAEENDEINRVAAPYENAFSNCDRVFDEVEIGLVVSDEEEAGCGVETMLCIPILNDVHVLGTVVVVNKRRADEVVWDECSALTLTGHGRSGSAHSWEETLRRSPFQLESDAPACFSDYDRALLEITSLELTRMVEFKYLDLCYLMQCSGEGGDGREEHLQSLLAMYDPAKRVGFKIGSVTGQKTRQPQMVAPNFRRMSSHRQGSLLRIPPGPGGEAALTNSPQDPQKGPPEGTNEASGGIEGDLVLPTLQNLDAVSKAELMVRLSSWELDVLAEPSEALVDYGVLFFERSGIMAKFGLPPALVHSFLNEVRQSYLANPYHNWAHGFSVLHGSTIMLAKGARELLQDLDVLGLFIATVCHDVGHPGTNNAFQIKSGSSLALLYNDVSVLENFHASKTFQILKKDGCNLLHTLTSSSRSYVRDIIIKAILSTDISKHFKFVADIKAKVQSVAMSFVGSQRGKRGSSNKLGVGTDARDDAPGSAKSPKTPSAMSPRLPHTASSALESDSRVHNSPEDGGSKMMYAAGGVSAKTRGSFVLSRRASGSSLLSNRSRRLTGAQASFNRKQTFAVAGVKRVGPQLLDGDGPSSPEAVPERMCPCDIFKVDNAQDRAMVLEVIISTADLSNPVLRFDMYRKWTLLVVEEFYNQFRQEELAGLPSEPLMQNPPHDTKALAKLQLNFIDFVVAPLWAIIHDIFPQLEDRFSTLETNRETWNSILETGASEHPNLASPREDQEEEGLGETKE